MIGLATFDIVFQAVAIPIVKFAFKRETRVKISEAVV